MYAEGNYLFLLNVIILSVIMLTVIAPSIVLSVKNTLALGCFQKFNESKKMMTHTNKLKIYRISLLQWA
jgi:hypothetical protein